MNESDEKAIIEGLHAFARILAQEFAIALEASHQSLTSAEAIEKRAPLPHPSRYITARELADLLSVSISSIYNNVSNGSIPAIRLGNTIRFDPEAVIETLGNNGVED